MIVLDTHALIWLNDDAGRLSDTAREAIRRDDEVGISAISLWEVSMLWQYGRIELSMSLEMWLEKACLQPKIRILPITVAIATRTARLEMHGDPADRLIVASALVHHCALVTRDENIQNAKIVRTIW